MESDIRYSNNRSQSPTPHDYRMNATTYNPPQIITTPTPVYVLR